MNQLDSMLDASGSVILQEMRKHLDIAASPWADMKEAERYTKFSRTVLLDAYHKGDLEGFKPKGRAEWRFHKLALDNWIMGKRQAKRDRIPEPIHPAEQRSKGILPI